MREPSTQDIKRHRNIGFDNGAQRNLALPFIGCTAEIDLDH
jgi:hypothetical protein